MKTKRTILIVSIGVIILLIVGFCEEMFAVVGGYPPGTGGSVSSTKPPVPPVIHPVVPPQFSNKWSITEVVNSLQGNGLEISNIKPITEADYSSLPTMAKEGIKFSILSVGEDVAGCILSFDEKHDLEKVRKYYLSLNKKNKLHSWSFVKDNILLVLEGRLLQEADREFENILDEFG